MALPTVLSAVHISTSLISEQFNTVVFKWWIICAMSYFSLAHHGEKVQHSCDCCISCFSLKPCEAKCWLCRIFCNFVSWKKLNFFVHKMLTLSYFRPVPRRAKIWYGAKQQSYNDKLYHEPNIMRVGYNCWRCFTIDYHDTLVVSQYSIMIITFRKWKWSL
jgi:hypothetical protein